MSASGQFNCRLMLADSALPLFNTWGFPNSYGGSTSFVSEKGVSQAQSGKGGRKGCAPLGSCMPVDSATAYVRNAIASEAHARKGGAEGRGRPYGGKFMRRRRLWKRGGGEGGKWRVSASIDARSPYPSDAVWVHPRSPDAYPDVRKMISAGVSSQAVLRQYLAVSFRRSRHWAYRLRPSRLAPQ